MADCYTLYGSLGSPYSQKMRAYLRYRRIPFVWVGGRAGHEIAQMLKAPVIPVLRYPDGGLANDSTALIADLEARHAERRATPDDEVQRFLALLIEDFADEWLTKAMFHYRWFRERDQLQMSRWLAFDAFEGGGLDGIERFASMFAARQIGRMALVGCTEENRPVIEGTTRAVLAALEAHVVNTHGLFGTRPSQAEFALFGQLSQLGTDPTAQEMLRADFPYAYRWLAHVDDLSGVEGVWSEGDEQAPVIARLLAVIGEAYLPFLIANAHALEQGAAEVSLTIAGQPYAQVPFKYQAKCLAELRRLFAGLSPQASERVTPMLRDAGCLSALIG